MIMNQESYMNRFGRKKRQQRLRQRRYEQECQYITTSVVVVVGLCFIHIFSVIVYVTAFQLVVLPSSSSIKVVTTKIQQQKTYVNYNNNNRLLLLDNSQDRKQGFRKYHIVYYSLSTDTSLSSSSSSTSNSVSMSLSNETRDSITRTPTKDDNVIVVDSIQSQQQQKYQRRQKKNKYSNFSKINTSIDENDPLDKLLEESQYKNQRILQDKETKLQVKQQQQRNKNRSKVLPNQNQNQQPNIHFPDTKEINPYDPTTFGYIEIGTIVQAHGVLGMLKLRTVSDGTTDTNKVPSRICTPNIQLHIKYPNKRAPRPITILSGKKHQTGSSSSGSSLSSSSSKKKVSYDEYLIQLDNIYDRTIAQTYRGCILYIRKELDEQIQLQQQQEQQQQQLQNGDNLISSNEQLPQQQQDEYEVSDLVGMNVYLIPESHSVYRRQLNSSNMDIDDDNDDDVEDEEDGDNYDETDEEQYSILDDYVNDDDDEIDNDDDDEDEEPLIQTTTSNAVDFSFLEDDNTNKQFVGKINGIVFSNDFCSIPGLGHDYLEIRIPYGIGGTFTQLKDQLVLIPFVPQLVPIVNSTTNEIYIDPPYGLLDLTYVRNDKTRIKAFLPPSLT